MRDDGLDIGNPLFLVIGWGIEGPLDVQAERAGATNRLTARGFKPGEVLSV